MTEFIGIKEIWQKDKKNFGILWTDGQESNYNVHDLRQRCPCASCVDEMTGRRIISAEDISQDVRPLVIKSVGRYALQIEYDDGHNTGIYSFENLRNISNHDGKGSLA